jgi:hypothetical protein
LEAGIEIESKIVSNLAEKHNLFISECWCLFHGIVQNNSILVWKVEYFYTSLLPLYMYCTSCLCTLYCTFFLHAERNKIQCEEDEIWCQSFSPVEPNVRYMHHVMWCVKLWTLDIEDFRVMAFLCSAHLNSHLLHIMSGI